MTDKLPTFDEVVHATAKHTGIPAEVITNSRYRIQDVVYARHLAIYITRQLTFLSWNKLAEQQALNHDSVLYANRKISKVFRGGGEAADRIRSDIKAIIELLKA